MNTENSMSQFEPEELANKAFDAYSKSNFSEAKS